MGSPANNRIEITTFVSNPTDPASVISKHQSTDSDAPTITDATTTVTAALVLFAAAGYKLTQVESYSATGAVYVLQLVRRPLAWE